MFLIRIRGSVVRVNFGVSILNCSSVIHLVVIESQFAVFKKRKRRRPKSEKKKERKERKKKKGKEEDVGRPLKKKKKIIVQLAVGFDILFVSLDYICSSKKIYCWTKNFFWLNHPLIF